MTHISPLTIEDWTALRNAILDHLGDWPHSCARKLPEADAPVDDINAAGVFDHLESKAAYLEWVRSYKAMIKTMSAAARDLKADRRTSDICAQATAQERLSWLREATRMAILQRRLGKTWSRARRAQRLEEAA